jgi:hypothetical protein
MSVHDHDARSGGWHRWFARGGRIVPALAVVGAGAIVLAVVNWGSSISPTGTVAAGAIPLPGDR